MTSLMTKLLQEGQRTKRLIKAAPGHLMDQFAHYAEDFKETSKQIKQYISDAATSGKSGLDEAKIKKAIEEAAGNAIPGGGAVAGMFGGAGRQDLVLTRGISLSSLLSRLYNSKNFNKLPDAQQDYIKNAIKYNRGSQAVANPHRSDVATIRHPSIAIHPTDVGNPFADGVTLVLRPKFFDPANTARSKLYNRDIYSKVSSADDFFKPEWHGKPAALDPRLTEQGLYDVTNMDHWLQVLASPKFKSFANYEASKAGAATIDSYHRLGFNSRSKARMHFKDAVSREIPHEQFTYSSEAEFLNFLKDYAEAGAKGQLGKTSKHVVELASKMPSKYAELKYAGNMPMNPDTLLGIIMHYDSQVPLPAKVVSNSFPGVPIIKEVQGVPRQYIMDILAEQIRK